MAKCKQCTRKFHRGVKGSPRKFCSKECYVRSKGDILTLRKRMAYARKRDRSIKAEAKRIGVSVEVILRNQKGISKKSTLLPLDRAATQTYVSPWKTSEAFYASFEWRALRYKALQAYGRKCQCCGAMPPEAVIHVDHIKPRSLYPHLELVFSNLQVLCSDCNIGKSNWDETDFRNIESLEPVRNIQDRLNAGFK